MRKRSTIDHRMRQAATVGRTTRVSTTAFQPNALCDACQASPKRLSSASSADSPLINQPAAHAASAIATAIPEIGTSSRAVRRVARTATGREAEQGRRHREDGERDEHARTALVRVTFHAPLAEEREPGRTRRVQAVTNTVGEQEHRHSGCLAHTESSTSLC